MIWHPLCFDWIANLYACLLTLCLTHAWNLDAWSVGKDTADWNFVLPVCEPDTKHTIEDPNVAYISGLPNELVVAHILPFLLHACDRLLRVVPNDVSLMCDLRGYNRNWRWLISFTLNFTSLRVVKHWLRSLRGHRLRGWFHNKVLSKYNHCLQLFKTRVLCPPDMSLQFKLPFFLTLAWTNLSN